LAGGNAALSARASPLHGYCDAADRLQFCPGFSGSMDSTNCIGNEAMLQLFLMTFDGLDCAPGVSAAL
jgi:hypothetical protein